MSKINQIQTALRELDGGRFQKFADSYLFKKGYSNINPIGSVPGSDKVRNGTPDTLLADSDGKYLFAEYTNTEPRKLFSKIQQDLEKCLNQEKTGIPVAKIKEVIYCHTGSLKTEQHESLNQTCLQYGVNLSLFGLETISYDLLERYPGLALDHLGISIDTGQIVDLDSFIRCHESSKFSTRISNEFYFRDQELKDILCSIGRNTVTIVSGSSGVGKTRIAIESYRHWFKENGDWKTYFVFNKGQDLFDDLKSYFSDSGKFLIIVDDANRISGFEYIIQLLQFKREDQDFKLLVTVRDYAIEQIRRSCESISDNPPIHIEPLPEREIRELLEDEYEILNPLYLDRIIDISSGNPRLAIMAAMIAKENDTLQSIHDVSSLYDRFFESLWIAFEGLTEKSTMKVAGIISFFRTIDRENEELVGIVTKVFEVTAFDFWLEVEKLHAMEIVDLYDDSVVKITDQVFSTYLFYRVFFREKIIPLSKILVDMFPDFHRRIVDSISPVIRSFGAEGIVERLRREFDRCKPEIERKGEEVYFQFLRTFWFISPNTTLSSISKYINATGAEMVDDSRIVFEPSNASTPVLPEFVTILPRFKGLDSPEKDLSLYLLFQYAEKNRDKTPLILNLLEEGYGIEKHSASEGYESQIYIVDKLVEFSSSNEYFTRITMAFAVILLKTTIHYSNSKGNRTIQFTRLELHESAGLRKLRVKLIHYFIAHFMNPFFKKMVLGCFLKLLNDQRLTKDAEIVKNDMRIILPFARDGLNLDNLMDCYLVNEVLAICRRFHVEGIADVRDRFQSLRFSLVEIFFRSFPLESRRRGYQYVRDPLIDKIRPLMVGLSETDYMSLFEDFALLHVELDSHQTWEFQRCLVFLFEDLRSRNPDLFNSVTVRYLNNGNVFKFHPSDLLNLIQDNESLIDMMRIIEQSELAEKASWLFFIYARLPATSIEQDSIDNLLNLYENAPIESINIGFDFLSKFDSIQRGFRERVFNILIRRASNDIDFGRIFDFPLINTDSYRENFSGIDLHIAQEVYLIGDRIGSHVDFDGSILFDLIERDPSFLLRFFENRLLGFGKYYSRQNDRDYSLIWLRSDYLRLMDQVALIVYEAEKSGIAFDYFRHIFTIKAGNSQGDEIANRQNSFIRTQIERNISNSKTIECIFRMIQTFDIDRQILFYSEFFRVDSDIGHFKELILFPTMESWSNSRVPLLTKKIEKLQRIMELCQSIEFIAHRQFLEEQISHLRREIEKEKKNDFMEEW
ncbi:MAG: hypothetical protein CVV45_05780 [Spirochaetae bacterium HGW-Spirochaetae-10]|nr:MAG: hypothetical protein CVV45_05780 [Spirochaetae bacterium HGW-Spirochaetae-10]